MRKRNWRKLVGQEPRVVVGWRYAADFEAQRREPTVVRWRKAVMGPDGPESPTTRLVLLALGSHMNEQGGSCFPSQELLAKETGLSERTVQVHLEFADLEGWIEIRKAQGYAQGWRRNEYQATIPTFGDNRGAPRLEHPRPRQAERWLN